jgi:hypothetical protein
VPDESTKPLDFYSRRSRELISDFAEAKEKLNISRASLLVLALIAGALGYKSFVVKSFPLWLPVVVIPFGALINRQVKRTKGRSLELASLVEYYDNGIARLHLHWEPLDEGQEFKDQEHSTQPISICSGAALCSSSCVQPGLRLDGRR